MDRTMRNPGRITTVIADDAKLMRDKLRVVCRNIAAIKIIGEVEDGRAAFDLCMAMEPDLLLSDVQMLGLTGMECADKLVAAGSKTHIVLCTSMGQAGIIKGYDKMIKPFHTEQLRAVLYAVFGDIVLATGA